MTKYLSAYWREGLSARLKVINGFTGWASFRRECLLLLEGMAFAAGSASQDLQQILETLVFTENEGNMQALNPLQNPKCRVEEMHSPAEPA